MNNSTQISFLPEDPLFFKITMAILAITGAIIIGKTITIYLKRSFSDDFRPGTLELISKTIYYTILLIVIAFVVLPVLGLKASSLLVAGGVVGIILGFASQSIVGNLISGIFLMVERPIEIGQQVDIEGNLGTVEDVNIFSTIIRGYDGLYLRIPNEKVFTGNITNYVENVARRFDYDIGIRYSDDADQAIGIIKELIEAHPYTLKQPESLVFVNNLGDNAVVIKARIWCPATEWYTVKTELLWTIKKTLENNNIEIAFPQRTLWFANGPVSKNNEDKDYTESGMEENIK
jgi:small-conductance mechanosensitive channel